MKYKSLSVVYPNGSRIAAGEKTIEVRSWQPPVDFSGDLLIVENKKFLRNEGEIDEDGIPVALVKIKKVRTYDQADIPAACASRWDPGYFSWELTDVRPIRYSGKVIAARRIYETELDLSENSSEVSARNLLEKYKVEINRHDFSSLEPLISKNCKFWFSSGTYQGLEQTRAAFEKTWNLIQNEVYTISDVEWLSEDTEAATCTYTYHWAGIIHGEPREGQGRGTSVFRVEDGQWKIAHEHLSPFPA